MSKTSFINVDLELSSYESLSSAVDELADRLVLLQNRFEDGEYFLSFECVFNGTDANSVIEEFLRLIDLLIPLAKEKLLNSHRKVLDIGYVSGEECVIKNVLAGANLAKVAMYGFDIYITVYPLDEAHV
ncbi:hypothetical protein [Hahella sp. HN01]|uniref:hypothetical protein n=1 Tax=Hahella sp. HN01 TaxID=2847262 RepID=UPI001C1EC848|nr:hypothetical protein [Hahella sp. HN01]MBU6953259.1 hypothetical protein [Hahella sp. HN01]